MRRRCHVDPDQTYLTGFGGAARPACAVAFALPEFFGGVVAAGEGTPLNDLEYLRWRARDRLSVALVAPGKDHPLGPYFDDLGVRRKAWTDVESAPDGPPAATVADLYGWLAADRDRRRAEARTRPGLAAPDEAYTNLQQAALTVDAAKAELMRPDGAYRAATLLEGVDARWGRTQPADAARTLLRDLRRPDPAEAVGGRERRGRAADPDGRSPAGGACRRPARALRAWDALAAAHADTPEGKKASEEVKRLTTALAATPYLGLTVDGEFVVKTVAPGGPAAAAGVKVGDRLAKLGATMPATTDDLRRALQALKPGDKISVDVLREGAPVTLELAVGAPPGKQ